MRIGTFSEILILQVTENQMVIFLYFVNLLMLKICKQLEHNTFLHLHAGVDFLHGFNNEAPSLTKELRSRARNHPSSCLLTLHT